MTDNQSYLDVILKISEPYLKETFAEEEKFAEFIQKIEPLRQKTDTQEIIQDFIELYISFVK